jgi:hypothetical protein
VGSLSLDEWLVALFAIEQTQELFPRLRAASHGTEHAACGCAACCLLHTSHDHAKMTALHDNSDALRLEYFGDGQSNLFSQSFLYLQPSAEHLGQPGQLAESQDPTIWDVADMHLTNEGDHMMFAETEDLDIFDNDKLVVIFVEDSAIDEISHVLFVAFCEVHESFRVSLGGLAKSFSLGIFADTFEDGSDGTSQFIQSCLSLLGGLVEAFARTQG